MRQPSELYIDVDQGAKARIPSLIRKTGACAPQ
jgi:hypothetical protein